MKNVFPDGKRFAFTIIDDTDNATLESIKPVYELLKELGFRTTKTVWVYPSRDRNFGGHTLQDSEHLSYIRELAKLGFEVALHNVGSGSFTRDEIIAGIEEFEDKIGYPPKLHVNHAWNPDNLYWGHKRFRSLVGWVNGFIDKGRYSGEVEESPYFWGDIAREKIKYVRNYTFPGINLDKYDPWFPYHDSQKPFVNYWFSSVDAKSVDEFILVMRKENIDKLVSEKGVCILYTHFSYGFTDTGEVHPTVKEQLVYLSQQQGYFVPASTLLDHLLNKPLNISRDIKRWMFYVLDIRWLISHFQMALWRRFPNIFGFKHNPF